MVTILYTGSQTPLLFSLLSWPWPIFLLLVLWSILIRCMGPRPGLVGIGKSKAVVDGEKPHGKRTLCLQDPATLPRSPRKATIA